MITLLGRMQLPWLHAYCLCLTLCSNQEYPTLYLPASQPDYVCIMQWSEPLVRKLQYQDRALAKLIDLLRRSQIAASLQSFNTKMPSFATGLLRCCILISGRDSTQQHAAAANMLTSQQQCSAGRHSLREVAWRRRSHEELVSQRVGREASIRLLPCMQRGVM